MNYLQTLFSPRSIAVIGASGREGSLGKMFMDALTGLPFKGEIYPVNPKTDKINGLICHKNIRSLPGKTDLAVILLSKELVLMAIDDLAAKGIKTVIVISAGFREVGGEGISREKALMERIRHHGMRMLGPNCMGVFNTAAQAGLNATFSPIPPRAGNTGFISQSGALGVAVLDLSKSLGLGFSCFASTGNKADISEVDCLEYFGTDPNTKVVILYQESIDNPDQFRKVCARIIPDKPVLSLKAGRTQSGLKAASSHTGALAADDLLMTAFLKQCGIIRCESLNEMLNSALAFESGRRLSGARIAVVTNAGGPGILASDALEKQGLHIQSLSDETMQKLQTLLPAEASVTNPIDMIASAGHETYRDVCKVLVKDGQIDCILIIIVRPPIGTTTGRIIDRLRPILEKTEKYITVSLMTDLEENDGRTVLNELKIPVYKTPESAAQSLGNLLRYKRIQEHFCVRRAIFDKNVKQVRPATGTKRQAKQSEIFPLLDIYQLNYAPFLITDKKSAALQFFRQHDAVVLKTAHEEIIHKSDQGLVLPDLVSEQDVSEAFDQIQAKIRLLFPDVSEPSFMIQQMIDSGVEFVLGSKKDVQFGTVIMFGIGGIFVELYRDISFRILPLDRSDANQMIEELSAKKILEGFRNFPKIETEMLVDLILNFARLVDDHPEIVEMDLNPIIWSEKKNGPIIVDSRCTMIEKDRLSE